MDEKESLKTKKEIKDYKMATFSKIADTAFPIVCFVSFLLLTLLGYLTSFEFLFLLILSAPLLLVGLAIRRKQWERKRKKAQPRIHPAATEPTAQLQDCPSCGKKLQPDWKVCAYCGKRLKKSKPEEKHPGPSPAQVEEGVERALKKRERERAKRVMQVAKKPSLGRAAGVFMILGSIAYVIFGISNGLTFLYLLAIIEFMGATDAIRGRRWLFALFAAILGLNIPAVFILAFARDEFKLASGKVKLASEK